MRINGIFHGEGSQIVLITRQLWNWLIVSNISLVHSCHNWSNISISFPNNIALNTLYNAGRWAVTSYEKCLFWRNSLPLCSLCMYNNTVFGDFSQSYLLKCQHSYLLWFNFKFCSLQYVKTLTALLDPLRRISYWTSTMYCGILTWKTGAYFLLYMLSWQLSSLQTFLLSSLHVVMATFLLFHFLLYICHDNFSSVATYRFLS